MTLSDKTSSPSSGWFINYKHLDLDLIIHLMLGTILQALSHSVYTSLVTICKNFKKNMFSSARIIWFLLINTKASYFYSLWYSSSWNTTASQLFDEAYSHGKIVSFQLTITSKISASFDILSFHSQFPNGKSITKKPISKEK